MDSTSQPVARSVVPFSGSLVTMKDLVLCTCTDGVATLELNRPRKRNALSPELITALNDVLGILESDDSLRVLVLGGQGESFCAGMDLREVLSDPEAMAGMLRGLSLAMRRIRRLPVPVIARVNGAAIGGGCGLCVVADIAMTHPDAKLGYPEVGLGVCPAVVAPWLIQKIGAGKARSLLIRGGTMNGQEALSLGLVDELHSADSLEDEAAALARDLCKGGREAVAVTKHWLNELDGSCEDAACEKAAELSAQVIAGQEAQERLKALYGD